MPLNDILINADLPAMQEKFFSKARVKGPDDCWEWKRGFDPAGYGQAQVRGHLTKAHRISWVLTNGPMPDSGRKRSLSVCHSCDNRGCVNPAHLFLGTDADNIADMMRKGRQACGEKHYTAKRRKLTTTDVLMIRVDTRRAADVATAYGLPIGSVYDIQRGKSWAHLGPTKPPKRAKKATRHQGPRRKRAPAYSIEIEESVRNSQGTLREIAAAHGMSTTTAWTIRRKFFLISNPPTKLLA